MVAVVVVVVARVAVVVEHHSQIVFGVADVVVMMDAIC